MTPHTNRTFTSARVMAMSESEDDSDGSDSAESDDFDPSNPP